MPERADTVLVAIVGMACRFPSAAGPDALWRLLLAGCDAISEVPDDRWDAAALYDKDPAAPGKVTTRWGGFLDDVAGFDREFFGISRREAAHMDPQQRLLLELAWEALEDTGEIPAELAESLTGVFIGISANDYSRAVVQDAAHIDAYTGSGNAYSVAANRISYFLGARGPSLAIDTACSSSLVAVHLACRSLAAGESALALAGGVNLMLSPEITINFSKAGLMAPDGRCKAFDARANGYVRSEGGGLVVLKRLEDALADRDRIYAVVRGSVTNHDGRTNGLMAPSPAAQEALLRAAHRGAGVAPADIQYLEAHGTGTALGDAVEAKALGAVFAEGRPQASPLMIGSIKTNIGHAEAAAGVAGLIKAALSLDRRTIPPSLHFQTPNPYIDFNGLRLAVPTVATPWPDTPAALAGVSSFGFGGTNAHVILEQAPAVETTGQYDDHAPVLLPVSAHDPRALRDTALAYRDRIAVDPDMRTLADIAYSASCRRTHHEHRVGLIASSPADAVELLDAFDRAEPRLGLAVGHDSGEGHRIAFVISSSAPEWPSAARELIAREPVFETAVREHASPAGSLFELLESGNGPPEIAGSAISAIQVGLTALWRSWGIVPDAVFEGADAVDRACDAGHDVVVEIGTDAVLADAGDAAPRRGVIVVPSLRQGEDPHNTLLDSAARLHAHGCPLDWPALPHRSRRHVGLPAYPWQRERCWLDVEAPTAPTPDSGHPLLSVHLLPAGHADAEYWEADLSRRDLAYLRDHRVHGAAVFPATGYLEMAVAAAESAFGTDRIELRDVAFARALLLPDEPATRLQLALTRHGAASAQFEIASRREDAAAWTVNCSGRIAVAPATVDTRVPATAGPEYETFARPEYYERLREYGHQYGTAFQGLTRVMRRGREAIGEVKAPDVIAMQLTRYRIHPAVFDAALQVLAAPIDAARAAQEPFIPVSIERVWVRQRPGRKLVSHATLRPVRETGNRFEGDVMIRDADGREVAGVRGLRVQRLGGDAGPSLATALHRLSWKPSAPTSCDSTPGSWVVVADDTSGVGDAVVDLVRTRGGVALLAGGPGRQLSDALAELDGDDVQIVHLESLDAVLPDDPDDPAIEREWTHGCAGALAVVDALTDLPASARRRVWFVTRGAQRVNGERTAPAGAPVWGFARAVAQEHARIWGGLIDLDPDSPAADAARAIVEAVTARDGEDEVAYRDGRRHVARLVTAPAPPRPAAPLALRPDATYVVSGGLGGLGLLVARRLVERGARHLVLLSRRATTDVESLGATVRGPGIDVTDTKALRSLVQSCDGVAFPPIRGVIHAAGLIEMAPVQTLGPRDLANVMRPKATGAWLLHLLLRDTPLDFFVMFASATSLLGSPMLSAYAAANAALDGVAQHRDALGLPATSIDWAVWDQVGAGARHLEQGRQVLRGVELIQPTAGLALLEDLIGSQHVPQIGVMPVDWHAWRRLYPRFSQAPVLSELVGESSGVEDGAPTGLSRESLLAIDAAVRTGVVSSHLRCRLASILGEDEQSLDPHRPLTMLGIDSLMALELKNQIEAQLRVELPLVALLEGPSIEELAAQVVALLDTPPVQVAEIDETNGTDVTDVTDDELLARLPDMGDAEVDAELARMFGLGSGGT